MAQEPSLPTANPDRRRHLMPAPGGGHRIVPIRSALKTRKETMRGISRSPRHKPSPAIRLERKTITSTPSIISDRCRRTAKRHSDFVAVTAGGYPTRRHNNFNSAVRRRRRLPTPAASGSRAWCAPLPLPRPSLGLEAKGGHHVSAFVLEHVRTF